MSAAPCPSLARRALTLTQTLTLTLTLTLPPTLALALALALTLTANPNPNPVLLAGQASPAAERPPINRMQVLTGV